ncbi:MAG: prohibitin family protein [Candidatus Wildermuthbacteria bacterium]|nr:prohibitin family protein [Candidatus Wildermuthbacteria bacterium]
MMEFLQILLVLLSLVVVAVLVLRVSKSESSRYGNSESRVEVRAWAIVPAVLVVLVAFFAAISVVMIDPAERGVLVRAGAVTDTTFGEGLHFRNPFFLESVEVMDVQEHPFSADAAAASHDLQDVATQVTVNYSLDPGRVNTIYQTLRRDYIARIMVPSVQESVKAVTARYNAEALITERPKIRDEIESALKLRVEPHGILVKAVAITNFEFSPSFAEAVEAKVVASQRALEAENRLRQIEVEARQAQARAKGEADARIAQAEGERQFTVLRAQGEAEAIRLVAEQQAQANKLIAESLTEEVIQYATVNRIADNVELVIIPADQGLLLTDAFLKGIRAPSPTPTPAP